MKLLLRNILPLILILASLNSCKDKGLIPKDTMSEIYYDIYITDATIDQDRILKRKADTLRVYEPIFNKYGYTTEDYQRSVDEYLLRPDKFKKVFEKTQSMLEKRKSELEKILEMEGKWSADWGLLDSLELYTMEGVHTSNLYRYLRVMFFEPDSLVPMSPVVDSAFMERPVNAFFLFSDSAYNADDNMEFYATKGILDDITKIVEARDSSDSGDKPIPVPKTKPKTERIRNLPVMRINDRAMTISKEEFESR